MTSDHHTTTTQLESALAEAKAKAAEDAYHLELLLAAEKASHTDTLVKLRLTEERLAASEAERERLREVAEIRKRDSVEAEQALWKVHGLATGKDSVPGDYVECEREISEALAVSKAERRQLRAHLDMLGVVVTPPSQGYALDLVDPDSYMSADHDEPTDSDAAVTLVRNERPGE
jgi:hypothetical protein